MKVTNKKDTNMDKITEIVPQDLPEFAQIAFNEGNYFTESLKPKWAIAVLRKSFEDDPAYAYGWHCNIAMSMFSILYDMPSDEAHKLCDETSSRFMKLVFDVETKYPGPTSE